MFCLRNSVKALHVFFFSLILLLASCGGGGGDSSSGGGSNSIFTGTYFGTFVITISGPGGTFKESIAGSVIVANDGSLFLVVGGFGSGGGAGEEVSNCTAVPPTFLSGNVFSYSTNYTCTFPDLGTCSIQETGNGSINGNTLTASSSAVMTCPAGKVNITVTFSGTKQDFGAASIDNSASSKVGQTTGSVYLLSK
jgi:hypothetical protein